MSHHKEAFNKAEELIDEAIEILEGIPYGELDYVDKYRLKRKTDEIIDLL